MKRIIAIAVATAALGLTACAPPTASIPPAPGRQGDKPWKLTTTDGTCVVSSWENIATMLAGGAEGVAVVGDTCASSTTNA